MVQYHSRCQTVAKSYLFHNDIWSQLPLGPIIGRLNQGIIQEGEQLLIEFYYPLTDTLHIFVLNR